MPTYCPRCGYELTGLAREGTCPECSGAYTPASVRWSPRTGANLFKESLAWQWKRAPIISPFIALLTLMIICPMTFSPVGVHDYIVLPWVLLGGPIWVLIVIIKLLMLRVDSMADCADRRWIDRVRWFSAPVMYGILLLLLISGWGWDVRWAMHRSCMTATAESLRGNAPGHQFANRRDQPPGEWFVLEHGEPAWISHDVHGYPFGDRVYALMVYSPKNYPRSLNEGFEGVRLDPSPTPPYAITAVKVRSKAGGWWQVEAW